MGTLRVLLVHNSAAFGGAERYTVDLATGLMAAGHDVVFVGPASSPTGLRLVAAGVEVVHVSMGMAIGWHAPLGPLNEPLFCVDLHMNPWRRRFRRVVRELHSDTPFDVIHVQFIKERSWIGSLGRALGVPVVWTVHAPREDWMKRGLAASVFRSEVSGVARFVAVSQATARDLIAAGVEPHRVDVVYNGVDILGFAGGDRTSSRVQLRLEESLLVLVPARPHAEKGIDTLLEAARMLPARYDVGTRHPVAFVVAGGSSHLPSYAARASSAGIGEQVRFLGHRDDMPDLYAAADVVCLPSFREGLPYAISEAMAAGKPVIATDVGGVSEMVASGETGIIIPPGDADALASAVQEMGDPLLRETMGRAARERATRLFSIDGMISGTVHAYRRAIDSSSHA
ncbi:MAG TPA: hypothetical protein DCP20_11225 [Coriobacteriia bacterium]|nr:hypothetical protein [Coriobacteriia bacterium]